jgi:formiminoglutamase
MMVSGTIPTSVTAPPMREGDPRIGHLLMKPGEDNPKFGIVGFPTDAGVRVNGGRFGAAAAPDIIRKALYALAPDARHPEHRVLIEATCDLGNVEISGDLDLDQARLGRIVRELLDRAIVPIVLGGGHETSYGHFLGYVAAHKPVSIVNVDAHADVRPLIDGKGHSGSPFRQALLHPSKMCEWYGVCGLLPHATSVEHLAFIRTQGGDYQWSEETTRESVAPWLQRKAVMMTMDIDALAQHHAPGVSAPTVNGMDLDSWLSLAWEAGSSSSVRSIDIVECNPAFDQDGATARVAALTIWYFMSGATRRAALRAE